MQEEIFGPILPVLTYEKLEDALSWINQRPKPAPLQNRFLHLFVLGGREENQALLQEKFDKIFSTGSVAVGKQVMESAARHLTPVTLELGGKSPCIVEKSSKIRLAARRIVFGKFINCGSNLLCWIT